jgi:large repetitive protein
LTRARDVANVLSTATSLATDTETAAAISSHATAANGHISYGNTASRPASPITGQVYSNTETGFTEVYSGSTYGWEQVGGIASTPTGVTATNQGSGRAFNNGQASVAFTPGTIAGRSYTVTSSPGGYTGTASSSPITVTGLQSSTQYTYTVTATNNYGTSSASSASSGVTATTVPQAPTIGTASAADQSATLTFTAGANGGSSITNYKYSTDNSTYTAFSPAQTSSPLSISGLTNGTSYSFYLKAVNANGDSAASSISNSITPAAPPFQSIATITVTSPTQSSIVFNSIPTNLKNLQIRAIHRNDWSINMREELIMRFNSDSTSGNYEWYYFEGDGSATLGAGGSGSASSIGCGVLGGDAMPANTFGYSLIDIYDYNNSNKKKTVKTYSGVENNGGWTWNRSGIWNSTNAITSITLTSANGKNFKQYTTFALYGMAA